MTLENLARKVQPHLGVSPQPLSSLLTRPQPDVRVAEQGSGLSSPCTWAGASLSESVTGVSKPLATFTA
jgi:hypothetical protein